MSKKIIGIAVIVLALVASILFITRGTDDNITVEASTNTDVSDVISAVQENNNTIKSGSTSNKKDKEQHNNENSTQESRDPIFKDPDTTDTSEGTEDEQYLDETETEQTDEEEDSQQNEEDTEESTEETEEELNYYESIKSDSEETYNVMKPTGGYGTVDISESELESVDVFENHFDDIFGQMFIDDEYILGLSRDEITLKTDTFETSKDSTSVHFEYSRFADTDMIAIINRNSRHILYDVNF